MFVKDLNISQNHDASLVAIDPSELQVLWQQDHFVITHVYEPFEISFKSGGNYSCRAEFTYQNNEMLIASSKSFVDVRSKFSLLHS